MIFQHTLELVLNGDKTQTRRVISPNSHAIRAHNNKITSVVVNGRDKWRVGSTYAVQPARGCPQVARIQITAIRSQVVKYISTADAIAEGFKNRSEFLNMWRSIHGNDSFDSRVWVVEFEVVAFVAEKQKYSVRPTVQLAHYSNVV
jgi:hypothetical protein